jgi:hypothetical protein
MDTGSTCIFLQLSYNNRIYLEPFDFNKEKLRTQYEKKNLQQCGNLRELDILTFYSEERERNFWRGCSTL